MKTIYKVLYPVGYEPQEVNEHIQRCFAIRGRKTT